MNKFKFLKLILIAIIFTASDPHFGFYYISERIPKQDESQVKELPWMTSDSFRHYLEDQDNRVSDIFKISPFFYNRVNFWFMIYTQFKSSHVVIHDKDNISLIYKVLDFSSIYDQQLHSNILYILQEKLTKEKVEKLKNDLSDLAKHPERNDLEARNMYRVLIQAGLTIPEEKRDRSKFFNDLRSRVRTQTGQMNFIRDGILRSLPYQKSLKTYFKSKNLPHELLAIPFLESSFNPKAESKVGALGPWQFMPLISKYYMPKNHKQFDYRSNVGVASISAAHLLSENYRILKSWDLAVTAYNSGTKHLFKTKRELGSAKVSLEDIIRHSDSENFGFASKNFYSEFLALVHALAYEDELFEGIHDHERDDARMELMFFISKCNLQLKKDIPLKLIEEIRFYNDHLKDEHTQLPRGAILTAKNSLPIAKFHALKFNHVIDVKPHSWQKLISNQSCSTR
jgi:membrane-bound lytic murein transglycosylase D